MKIISGPGNNSKLGNRVVSWSRPVGPSCPSDCAFLTGRLPNGELLPAKNLCYAWRLQDAIPETANRWATNFGLRPTQWIRWSEQLRDDLSEAGRNGWAVRIHVAGDFLRPVLKLDADPLVHRELDRGYLAAVLWAFRHASPRPAAFCYTHAWRELTPHRRFFERLGIELFASVHTLAEAWPARLASFRLAIDGGEKPDGGGPAWVLALGEKFDPYVGYRSLACPEQRLGHEKIDCSSCGYCFKPQTKHPGHVVFYRHGPGTRTPKTGAKHVE